MREKDFIYTEKEKNDHSNSIIQKYSIFRKWNILRAKFPFLFDEENSCEILKKLSPRGYVDID
jgi:hypothetical protein